MKNTKSDVFGDVSVFHKTYRNNINVWKRIRAFCEGARAVKNLDLVLDTQNWSNVLIPFSESMEEPQYELLKAEAELPGISAQFMRMVLGGLLRKEPSITISPEVPEIIDWLKESLTVDNLPLMGFIEQCIQEELQTSRGWISINYPSVPEQEFINMSIDDRAKVRPYPILWTAEEVINYRIDKDRFGKEVLTAVYILGVTEDYSENEHEPEEIPTIWLHEIVDGKYQVRIFKKDSPEIITQFPKANGEYLNYLPFWPVNGKLKEGRPVLETIIEKEAVLYNKLTRRNHVLFTAAAFTPVVFADIPDTDFNKIVQAGLGSWLHLPSDARIDVLRSPTDALQDMDRAIASNIEEIARLGIRMLAKTVANESGYARRLQDSPQTATISSLSAKMSSTLSQVLSELVSWHFNDKFTVELRLSNDFDEYVLGEGWLRLATEWYENGHLPRDVWLELLKKNDVLDAAYDDSDFTPNDPTTNTNVTEPV
jgi:hypothetical protein